MIASIQRWLGAVPLTDPIERRQARVFQVALICWLGLALIGVPLLFLQPGDQPAGELPPQMVTGILLLSIAGLSLLISPALALALLRRGRFNAAVVAASSGLLLGHSVATFTLGLGDATTLIVFQIPLALAGLLGNRRQLLVIAGLCIAVVVGVAILQSQSPPLAGYFLAESSDPNAARLTTRMAFQTPGFFIVVTIILAVLLDRFGSALREALAASLAREDELRHLQASLESIVDERTTALQQALSEVQDRAGEQTRLLAEIDQQRTLIQDLSVPVIPISDRALVMPLVGALTTERLEVVQAQGLHALERSSARTLVLDITGVPVVDSQVAQGILQTMRSARLLGAEVVLVGIRPEVAQTMVGLGIELRDVRTFNDLQSALQHMTV